MALLSTEDDESFDEKIRANSFQLTKVSVKKFVDQQNLFSRKLIFRRYRENTKNIKSIYVIIGIALFFSFLMGGLMMADVFAIYPQVIGMTTYLRDLTKVEFYSTACFNSLKQLSLNDSAVFNNTEVVNFALNCPKNLIDLRLKLARVR